MKMKELSGLDSQDLFQKELLLKKELFALNYQRKFGKVEKPARFAQIKKDIARIKTALRERKK